jgi:hypothetical protein
MADQHLPGEIRVGVACRVRSVPGYTALMQVSREWRAALRTETAWQSLCEELWPGLAPSLVAAGAVPSFQRYAMQRYATSMAPPENLVNTSTPPLSDFFWTLEVQWNDKTIFSKVLHLDSLPADGKIRATVDAPVRICRASEWPNSRAAGDELFMLCEKCSDLALSLKCLMDPLRVPIDDEGIDHVLTELEGMDLSLHVLAHTGVREAVDQLKRCQRTVHAARARALVDGWKRVLNDTDPDQYPPHLAEDHARKRDYEYDFSELYATWYIHRKSTGKVTAIQPENPNDGSKDLKPASMYIPGVFVSCWSSEPLDRRIIASRSGSEMENVYHCHYYINADGQGIGSVVGWWPKLEIAGSMANDVLYLTECTLSFQLSGGVNDEDLPVGWNYFRATSDSNFVASAIAHGLKWI